MHTTQHLTSKISLAHSTLVYKWIRDVSYKGGNLMYANTHVWGEKKMNVVFPTIPPSQCAFSDKILFINIILSKQLIKYLK